MSGLQTLGQDAKIFFDFRAHKSQQPEAVGGKSEMLFGDFVENLVGMDWVMVLTAIGLAVASALVAGLYPTWRACSVMPASQLKTQ